MECRSREARKCLREVANVISGYAFRSSEFVSDGIPVVKIGNIRVGFVDLSNAECVNPTFLSLDSKYHVNPGDILISLTGSHLNQPNSVVGRVALHPSGLGPCLLNQRVGKVIVRRPAECDSRFLYYFLLAEQTRREIAVMAHGAANQANVSPTQIESLEMHLPTIWRQKHVASILSAYDALIENNARRIAILEEMALALYREWFVLFRFPGHQKVKMMESPLGAIPEGWEVTTLGEQLVTLESGKRPKGGVGETKEGVPSIGAENIIGVGRYDFAKDKFVSHEFFEQMRKGVVRDRDIAIYKDGAYIGKSSYFRDGFPHSQCCVNEHVFLLRANRLRLTQNALYLWLQEPDTIQAIRATNANAAQPGINQQSVGGLELIISDPETASHFDGLVEPLLAEIINLAKRNRNLCIARDLLLPKLISGEIEVSNASELPLEATA